MTGTHKIAKLRLLTGLSLLGLLAATGCGHSQQFGSSVTSVQPISAVKFFYDFPLQSFPKTTVGVSPDSHSGPIPLHAEMNKLLGTPAGTQFGFVTTWGEDQAPINRYELNLETGTIVIQQYSVHTTQTLIAPEIGGKFTAYRAAVVGLTNNAEAAHAPAEAVQYLRSVIDYLDTKANVDAVQLEAIVNQRLVLGHAYVVKVSYKAKAACNLVVNFGDDHGVAVTSIVAVEPGTGDKTVSLAIPADQVDTESTYLSARLEPLDQASNAVLAESIRGEAALKGDSLLEFHIDSLYRSMANPIPLEWYILGARTVVLHLRERGTLDVLVEYRRDVTTDGAKWWENNVNLTLPSTLQAKAGALYELTATLFDADQNELSYQTSGAFPILNSPF